MRRTLVVIEIAFFVACGTWLIVSPGPWWWFKAAGGFVLYARAFSGLEFSQGLNPVRRWLRLPLGRGLQLMYSAYVVAGGLTVIGALSSLERAFGLIVAFGAFSFAWIWGCLLRESLRPESPPSRN